MFRKQSDNISIWVSPSPEEVSRSLDSIVNPLKSNETEVPTTEKLQGQLSNALSTLIPKKEYYSSNKEKFYKGILNVVSKPNGPVDVIVPIYNSIHIVEKCIKAVLTRTKWPYKLILVDDASDEMTKAILKEYADKYPTIISIITNTKNKGFSASVNRGIKSGNGKYIVLLNSDVIVTPDWLPKMIFALESDSRNQIVNPVTNNTALINVPMSPGASYMDMNNILQNRGEVQYPEIMPTGFCYGFRRDLLSQVGPFDESYPNFGEEMLALSTRIITGNGWKTLGDITEGDQVYGPDGRLHKVMKLTSIDYRNCYELEFDTGEKIIASEGHGWFITPQSYINHFNESSQYPYSWIVHNKAADRFDSGASTKEISREFNICLRSAQEWKSKHKRGGLRKTGIEYTPGNYTTEDLFNYGCVSSRGTRQSNKFNFWVPLAKPLEFPISDLILDPYVLGAWLGDGCKNNGQFTGIDPEIWENIEKAGFRVSHYSNTKAHSILGLVPYLRKLNLIKNKHIPEQYLFSSYEQRLSLVQGLMDTDGHCAKSGKCSFDNTNLNLIEGFAWLLRSLGVKCKINPGPPKKKEHHKIIYRVTFRVSKETPIFRLTRKLNRLPEKLGKNQQFHKIISIKPCPTVPTRCLSIDSPDHLFLAGDALIPTKNSDHWMKTISYIRGTNITGYRAVMADDTYVFHERGTSFSALGEEKHMGFRRQAADRFNMVWPNFSKWKKSFNIDGALAHIRSPILASTLNSYRKVPYRICWAVRSPAFCGGMKYITDIVNEINERGGDARVAVVLRDPKAKVPEPLGELRSGTINFLSEQDFLSTFTGRVFKNGVVVAATAELAPLVKSLCETEARLRPLLHVQSYEPELLVDKSQIDNMKQAFSLIPDIISNSHWITKILTEDLGLNVFTTISPGVDRKLFYPRDRSMGDDRLTVMVPMSTTYPFKGYDRGIILLQNLHNRAIMEGIDLRLLTYGVETIPELAGAVVALGPLPQARLSSVLSTEVDVFIDPAYVHSYGMPCIEALACGVPVICWDNKGISEYVKHGKTGLKLPNSMPPAEVAASVINLLKNKDQRESIRKAAIESLVDHDREQSVNVFIESIEKHLHLRRSRKRIVFITPHLRKHGGPTTILSMANALSDRGHDVGITSIYPDVSNEVMSLTDLPIDLNHTDIPPCDVLIVNSDNPLNGFFIDLPQAKKKILLKLSHNERFKEYEEASLNMKWDRIITSTEWLANVSNNPMPGWNHPPIVNAQRVGWFHYGHDNFKCPPALKTFRAGTTESPFRIVSLLHSYHLKGTQDALDGLAGIREHYQGKVRIELVGEHERKHLIIPNWVKYHESLSRVEMASLFKHTDIWVGVSHTEGLGRMALEAMSSSVACVLTDAHKEFVEHGKNCLLVPIHRPDAINGAVNKLLSDPKLLQTIAINGYKTAERYTDSTDCIDKLEKVIEEIC
jgi:glycosyltransferase involved in cell wall biosynthesis